MAEPRSSSNTPSGHKITTAADITRLRNEGKILTPQEIRELNTWIKALEDIAKLEDQLRSLEDHKRQRTIEDL